MAKIWPPRAWKDGDRVEYWQLNELSYNFDFLRRPPICQGSSSQQTAVAGSVGFVPLVWDVPNFDTDEMLDGATRIVFNTPGYYYIRLLIAWTPGPVSGVWTYPFNGVAVIAKNRGGSYSWIAPGTLGADVKTLNAAPANTSIGVRNRITCRGRFQEGDYVEAFVARAGGPPELAAGGDSTTKNGSFSARWLSI